VQSTSGSKLWRCILPETPSLRPAVFLDRDGTIADEVGYLNHVSRFRMFPFAAAAIRRLNEAGLAVIVVTNQSGVARGYFPESLVQEVNKLMCKQLAIEGARVDGTYYCPHGSGDVCECRKPKTGMLDQAAREHGLDLKRSFVVGDRYGDVELAFRAGATAVFVETGYGLGDLHWHGHSWPKQPHKIAHDLEDAVDWILRQPR
jgi:D-glycero-D-manno-heptose 1,7-bisphosphate phosphatase